MANALSPATTRAASPARVLAADPEDVVLEGLKAVLRRAGDLRLEATARTRSEAVHLVQVLKPEVALVDVRFTGQPNGVTLVRELLRAHSALGVVVFSDSSADGQLPRLVAAGARGYVPKDAGLDVLTHALRVVASGGWSLQGGPDAALLQALRCLARSGSLEVDAPSLGDREREYLRMMVEGLTDAQMARRLNLATPTVKAQLRRLYQQLGARNRAQALARAVVLGVLG